MEFNNGVYTVLMTPFNNDGTIDYESYGRLINSQINSDITGVVVLGTTSESPTLNDEEKMSLVEYVYQCFNETDKKVIVGIGGNNTMDTIKFGREVSNYCDYMMVTVPHYNKPSQEGIYQHFNEICSNETIRTKPIILYNIPSRTGVNMNSDTINRICTSNQNVCAIKEASGSISQVMEIISKCNIKVFSGDDSMTIPVTSVGGCGTISVVGNIYPNIISNIFRCCYNNDYDNARNIYKTISDVVNVLFIESNPTPGKLILNLKNVFRTPSVRLPLTQVSDVNKVVIESIMNKLDNLNLQ
tara:strand:+ start:4654 stop:5553 length:900 start_codon:yes stop_codon:yes gene_type:complete